MDRWIVDSEPGGRFPAWTRGNAADVFPEPVSPLFVSLYLHDGMSQALRDAYIDIGVYDFDEIPNANGKDHPVLFGVFGGQVYNPLSFIRVFGARMPGASPDAIDKAFFDERPDVPPYKPEPWHESAKHAEKLGAQAGFVLSTPGLPELDRDKWQADTLRASRPDFALLDVSALFNRVRAMVPYVRQTFETGMFASTLSSVGPGALGAICEALGDVTMSIRLLAGIEVDSAEPPKAMWALSRTARKSPAVTALFEQGVPGLDARLRASSDPDVKQFVAAFDDFLFNYGSRGANEYEAMTPSWEIYPDGALGSIDRMRVTDDAQDPAARRKTAVAERDRLAADIRAKLAGDPETLGLFNAALQSSAVFLGGRERAKTNVIKVIGEIKVAMREVARRMVEAGNLDSEEHIFMLLASEMDEYNNEPARFRTTLASRYAQYKQLAELEPPFVIDGNPPPLSQWAKKTVGTQAAAKKGDVLKGAAGSGGIAEGRARVILDPMDPAELEPGDVLIAPQTDPSWGPVFVPAAAVVVNVGAMGSHAMIVSRELGIPCVVSVENATNIIPDGAMVRVDGNAGTVTLL